MTRTPAGICPSAQQQIKQQCSQIFKQLTDECFCVQRVGWGRAAVRSRDVHAHHQAYAQILGSRSSSDAATSR